MTDIGPLAPLGRSATARGLGILLIFLVVPSERVKAQYTATKIHGQVVVGTAAECEDGKGKRNKSKIPLAFQDAEKMTLRLPLEVDLNGEFETDWVSASGVSAYLFYTVTDDFKSTDSIAKAQTLVAGGRSEVEPRPWCLVDKTAEAKLKLKKPAKPGGGTSDDDFRSGPFAGETNETQSSAPVPALTWNKRDIRGLVNPPQNAAGESPRIKISSIDANGEWHPEPEIPAPGGKFTISLQDPNQLYAIAISLTGFQPVVVRLEEDVTKLLVDERGALDFEVTLDPEPQRPASVHRDSQNQESSPSTQIEVVNLFEPGRRAEFHQVDLVNLPLRGSRSFDFFALLSPGILPAPEAGGPVGPGISPGVGSAGQFSANGLRPRENNFTVDGSDNNDEEVGARRQGFVHLAPLTIESTSEFQVISALADARYGRAIGAQANAFSRSGSRAYHLMAYSTAGSTHWDARNVFDRNPGAGPPSMPVLSSSGVPVKKDGSDLTVPNTTLANSADWHNRTGFTLGGPLFSRTPKPLFLFVAFEHERSSELRQEHFSVPTVKERGLFQTGEKGLPGGQYPASIGGNAIFSLFPFPNDPGGPYGANTYTAALPADAAGTIATIKTDQSFHAWKDHKASVRYSFADENSILPVTGGALYSSIRPKIRTQNIAALLNTNLPWRWVNTFRFSYGLQNGNFDEVRDPSLLGSDLFPGTHFLLNQHLLLNTSTAAPQFMTSPLATEFYTGPIGEVRVAGYSTLGADVYRFPQSRGNSTFQYADTAERSRGPLTLAAGFDIWSIHLDSSVDRNQRPRVDFYGQRIHGDPISGSLKTSPLFMPTDMVSMGIPSAFFQTLASNPPPPLELHRKQVDLFVHAQYVLAANLRVQAGFRLEFNREPEDPAGQFQSNYSPDALNAQKKLFSQSCVGANKSPGYCEALFTFLGRALPPTFDQVFGQNPLGKDFRSGFAWDPWRRGTTSIRGGWGTYTGQFPAVILSESRSYFPQFLPLNFAGQTQLVGFPFLFNVANKNFIQSIGGAFNVLQPGSLNLLDKSLQSDSVFALAGAVLGALNPVINPVQPAAGLHNPYSQQYGLTVEHELRKNYVASIAYIGTLGRHLLRALTPDNPFFPSPLILNPVQANPGSLFPVFRSQGTSHPIDFIGDKISRTVYSSTGSSSYNSLQAEIRGSDAVHGLAFGSAFTYSHSIDDASDFFDSAAGPALPQSSASLSERGPSGFDARIRWVTHFYWEPYRMRQGKIKGIENLNVLLRGWQFSGVYTAQSGRPFTVNSAVDVNQDGNLSDRLDTATLLDYGPFPGEHQTTLRVKPGYSPADLLSRYEHQAQGCPAPSLCDGAVGRNTFLTAGLMNMDLAASRSFRFHEGHILQFRAESFNLFNRAQYATPVRTVEAPGFGKAVNTITPNRSIQVTLRYSF